MEPEIYYDERDHEIGGVHYNGLVPGHGRFDFEEEDDTGGDDDDDDQIFDIAADVLSPQTVPVCPVTMGYELNQLASKAKLCSSAGRGQIYTYPEGEAHTIRHGHLLSWTPRDGSCEPLRKISNAPIHVDALSLGQLLWRCRGNASVTWMDGHHAINLTTGVAILDEEQRLRCWLPLA